MDRGYGGKQVCGRKKGGGIEDTGKGQKGVREGGNGRGGMVGDLILANSPFRAV